MKMKNRSELRDIIVKVIYQISIFEEANLEYDVDKLIMEQTEIQNDFVNNLVKLIMENKKDLEELANKYLNNWTLDRLSKVDQAIILLGICELKYSDTPSIVAINEAVELAKKYSDESVVKMVNGVLDKIYHDESK